MNQQHRITVVYFPVLRDSAAEMAWVRCRAYPALSLGKFRQPILPSSVFGHDHLLHLIEAVRGEEADPTKQILTEFKLEPSELSSRIVGHSCDLAVILADKRARFGFEAAGTEEPIIATGGVDASGSIAAIGSQDFARKARLASDWLCGKGTFVFPRSNLVADAKPILREMEAAGITCISADRVEELSALWSTGRTQPSRIMRLLQSVAFISVGVLIGVTVLAIVVMGYDFSHRGILGLVSFVGLFFLIAWFGKAKIGAPRATAVSAPPTNLESLVLSPNSPDIDNWIVYHSRRSRLDSNKRSGEPRSGQGAKSITNIDGGDWLNDHPRRRTPTPKG